jgi:hypothetical protein
MYYPCKCSAYVVVNSLTIVMVVVTVLATIERCNAAMEALKQALYGTALYCQSYSYNSVGGTCLFWDWSLFNAATLVWDATGTWTSYDHNYP